MKRRLCLKYFFLKTIIYISHFQMVIYLLSWNFEIYLYNNIDDISWEFGINLMNQIYSKSLVK